jgi:hypothetical protein
MLRPLPSLFSLPRVLGLSLSLSLSSPLNLFILLFPVLSSSHYSHSSSLTLISFSSLMHLQVQRAPRRKRPKHHRGRGGGLPGLPSAGAPDTRPRAQWHVTGVQRRRPGGTAVGARGHGQEAPVAPARVVRSVMRLLHWSSCESIWDVGFIHVMCCMV